jgi:glycosyltransferase involved in cell wall biosynthesis
MPETHAGRVDPLRIAVITRAMYPIHGYGGLERHVYDLVRHLLALDTVVTVITQPARSFALTRQGRSAAPNLPDLSHPDLSFEWIPYRTFPYAGRRGTTVLDRSTAYLLFGYRAGRRAARLAERGRIDLVYGLGGSALGYAMARPKPGSPGPPLVFNPQGLEEFGATDSSYAGARLKRLAYFPLQRAVLRCARAADRVIATDRALESVVAAHLRVTADRIRVVPNAIDLAESDRLAGPEDGARIRAEHGIGGDQPVLLSVGRLEENKGFQLLAKALCGLTGLNWRWVLVGRGPFRGRLEQIVKEGGIEDRVLFAGRVEDPALHAWYEAATLFVHPTLYEGSSLVTLEAMAHRRAVVGTRAGGLPDKIQDGVTGWLIEPGDSQALARAVGEGLSESARLVAMGAAGRRVVEATFAWPAVAERLLEVCREVVGP